LSANNNCRKLGHDKLIKVIKYEKGCKLLNYVRDKVPEYGTK